MHGPPGAFGMLIATQPHAPPASRSPPARPLSVSNVPATTCTVTVQSIRYRSVQLEPVMSVPLTQIPAPHDTASLTLVEQLVQWARRRIEERVFRPGMRMPSIRKLALDKGVSRFTVVEAYERLVAQGYLESRRGSGFFVRERLAGTPGAAVADIRPAAHASAPATIDVVWLLRNMLHTGARPERSPGLGYLPARWLDGELITNALRTLGRQSGAQMLGIGTPLGFLPLRQQLQTRLEELEIGASPDQIVMVSGV